MNIHTFHPDTHEHGLVDGCPRCAEHAEHPFESLDGQNLAALVRRVEYGLPARSVNEDRAMMAVHHVKRQAEMLARHFA